MWHSTHRTNSWTQGWQTTVAVASGVGRTKLSLQHSLGKWKGLPFPQESCVNARCFHVHCFACAANCILAAFYVLRTIFYTIPPVTFITNLTELQWASEPTAINICMAWGVKSALHPMENVCTAAESLNSEKLLTDPLRLSSLFFFKEKGGSWS